MKQYKVIRIQHKDSETLEKILNRHGEDNWQLIVVDGYAVIFMKDKRNTKKKRVAKRATR